MDIDYIMVLKEICESRIPVYCSYEGNTVYGKNVCTGFHRHHPFYKSKNFVPFIPSNHDSTKNIFDYAIYCEVNSTINEHFILEELSRVIYGIKPRLADSTLYKLKNILSNSNHVNKLIKERELEILRIKKNKNNLDVFAQSKGYTSYSEYLHGQKIKILWNNPEYKYKNTPKIIENGRNTRFGSKNMIFASVKGGKIGGVVLSNRIKTDSEFRNKISSIRSINMKNTWSKNKDLLINTINNNWKDPLIREKMLEGSKATRFKKGYRPFHNTKIQIRINPDIEEIPEGFIPGELWRWRKNK